MSFDGVWLEASNASRERGVKSSPGVALEREDRLSSRLPGSVRCNTLGASVNQLIGAVRHYPLTLSATACIIGLLCATKTQLFFVEKEIEVPTRPKLL